MPFLSVSIVLLAIFVGYSLSRYLTKVDAGLLNSGEVTTLTLLKTLIALEVLLPIGLYFGLMLGLGKLHSDSEVIAMQASGISESQMIRPVAWLAIPLALIIACLSIYVRPWAYTQSSEMLAIAKASSDIDRIKAGQFYLTNTSVSSEGQEGDMSGDRQRAIFIEKIAPDLALEQVFIRTREGDDLQIISSRTGRLLERPGFEYQKLELDNARIFKRVVDGPDLFANIDHFTMKVADGQPDPPAIKARTVPTRQLVASSYSHDRSELQWRLSTPITTVLLAMLTVPLSRSKPRQGRFAKVLLAFVIYAAYYNLIEISRTWVEQGTATSIWWAPMLLALLVAFSYRPWRPFLRRGSLLRK